MEPSRARRRIPGRLAALALGAATGCRVAAGAPPSADAEAAAAARALVAEMGCDVAVGRRLWRRPLTRDELETLDAVYVQGRGDFDVATSVQLVQQVIAASPNAR
jgi:hypothetical protein